MSITFMKKYFFIFLILLTSQLAIASEMKCEIDEFGHVQLSFIYNIDSKRNQVMSYYLGQEQDWKNPYAIRELCESLRKNILKPLGESWSHEICKGDGMVQYKLLAYSITEEARLLIKSESLSLWFWPMGLETGPYSGGETDTSFKRDTKAYDSFCAYPYR